MVNGDRALIASRRSADPAAVAISLQDHFPEAAKMLYILSLQGVAGRTEAVCKDLRTSTGTASRCGHRHK